VLLIEFILRKEKAMTRREVIEDLVRECGWEWPDGSGHVSVEDIDEIAANPWRFDICPEDLDGAVAGDVASTINLRVAFRLPVF
jgi:hypothetical protein